ncbi:MAG TPA: SdpI family protein [Parafilimonas sp.]|nr:SdpI family protein [Parafilimonas sp.]
MKIVLRRLIWLIMLLPAVYLAIVWTGIPQTVPMHFDLKGNVDQYGTKTDLLIMTAVLTGLNMLLYLVILNIYKIDPKKYAAQNKERLQRIGFSVSLYLAAVLAMLIYVISTNHINIVMKFVFVAMGLLFALIGNNMYNLKPNYFAGMRLPWTLENEDNWRATHHVAGRLWFFGGFVIALLAFVLNEQWSVYSTFIALSFLIFIPVIYSYRYYKRSQQKKSGS